MKIESKYLIDKAQAAEFAEARDSESQFFADIASILTPEALEEGVRIDFGSDKERFAQVIQMLALDDALRGEDSSAHIHNVTSNDFAGGSGFHGHSTKSLYQLPLAEMPDVVQAGMFDSYKRHDIYPTLDPKNAMVTAIIVTNIDKSGEKPKTDLEKPGVVVGVTRQYLPEFKVDEYDATDDLTEVVHKMREKHESKSTTIAEIAGRVAVDGYQLANPESNYFIEIGPLRTSSFVFSIELVGTYVGKDGYFILNNDRLELFVEPEGAPLEDVLPELV